LKTTYTDALKEAKVLADTSVVVLDTLSLEHPLISQPIYLVNDREELEARLEEFGEIVTFKPVSFAFKLPQVSNNGASSMMVSFNNVDRSISEVLEQIKDSRDLLLCKYRVYLNSGGKNRIPQNSPPITLTITDISLTATKADCKASFIDVINKPFPAEYYDRFRFPTL